RGERRGGAAPRRDRRPRGPGRPADLGDAAADDQRRGDRRGARAARARLTRGLSAISTNWPGTRGPFFRQQVLYIDENSSSERIASPAPATAVTIGPSR